MPNNLPVEGRIVPRHCERRAVDIKQDSGRTVRAQQSGRGQQSLPSALRGLFVHEDWQHQECFFRRQRRSTDCTLKVLVSPFCDAYTRCFKARAIPSPHADTPTTSCCVSPCFSCAAGVPAFRRDQRRRLPYQPKNWRLPLPRLEKPCSRECDVLSRSQR
jgi:hypothetical protein